MAEQGVGAGVGWGGEKVWPAMVAVPVRALPALGAARRITEPLPDPEAPEITVSHAALLVAVHGQVISVGVITTTLRFPPVAPNAPRAGLIENVHVDAGAC